MSLKFVSISWKGGPLDDTTIHFNEDLSVLIDEQSTVIESLRYVLNLEPVGEDAKKAHREIVHNVLGSMTEISLVVCANEQEFHIERTIPGMPIIRDHSGKVLNLLPSDLFPQIKILGHHEISEITKNTEAYVQLLNIEHDTTLEQVKADIKKQLEQSRLKIVSLDKEINQIQNRLNELPTLEKVLMCLNTKEQIRKLEHLLQEEQTLNTSSNHITLYQQAIRELQYILAIDQLPKAQVLMPLELNDELQRAVTQFQESLSKIDQKLTIAKSELDARKTTIQEKLEADGGSSIRLKRQIEELRFLKSHVMVLQQIKEKHEKYRKQLTAEWIDLAAKEFRQIVSTTIKEINKKLNNQIRIQMDFAGDQTQLRSFLKEHVGGRIAETLDAINKSEGSIREFASVWRLGRDALIQKYKLPPGQATNIAQTPLNVILQAEELDLLHSIQIELNIAPSGQPEQWRKLEDLSTNQKAAAVFLLLLLRSNAPIVIDQPENNVNNRFITDVMAPKIHEDRQHKQFIFATQNADAFDTKDIINLKDNANTRLGLH